MLSIDDLLASKNNIDVTADLLQPDDIDYLIELLSIKNNDIRYAAFLLLESRSNRFSDVYAYWDIFVEKLMNTNSYQRSIGVMMMASNIKWDKLNKFDEIAEIYLNLCDDEMFITARQTIQSIEKWVNLKPNTQALIVQVLLKIDISKRKDTQKKLLLLDILRILAKVNVNQSLNETIKLYVHDALKSGILDKKSTKEVEILFKS